MKEIVEIFQTREAIECMLTRLACHNIDEPITAELQNLRCELEAVEIEKKSKEDHLEVIEALLISDEDRSVISMRNHLRGTCERIVESYISNLNKTLNYV